MMGVFLHGLLALPVSPMETHLESGLQKTGFLAMALGSETLPNITPLFYFPESMFTI